MLINFDHLTWTSSICQRLKIPVKHMASSLATHRCKTCCCREEEEEKTQRNVCKFRKMTHNTQKLNNENDFSFGCWMFTMSHDVNDSWCVKIRWETMKNGLGFVPSCKNGIRTLWNRHLFSSFTRLNGLVNRLSNQMHPKTAEGTSCWVNIFHASIKKRSKVRDRERKSKH